MKLSQEPILFRAHVTLAYDRLNNFSMGKLDAVLMPCCGSELGRKAHTFD
jgi:hypothetical protein